jgi:hypothetical protein
MVLHQLCELHSALSDPLKNVPDIQIQFVPHREESLPPLERQPVKIIRKHWLYTGCFKKSFTTLKAYRNLYRGHTQRFELSKCSNTHRVLLRIVVRNCFDLFFRFLLHGTSTVTVHRPGKRVLRYSRTSPM